MKILRPGSPNRGVGWWRQEVPAALMRAAGHEVWTLNPHEENAGTESWLKEVVRIGAQHEIDVVWAGAYGAGTEALARHLDKINVPFIFDTDDLLTEVPDYNPAHGAALGPGSVVQRKVNRIVPFARLVTCSTPHLLEHYAGQGCIVHHCPNFADLTYFEKVQTPRLFNRKDPCLRVAFVYNHNRHGDYYPLLPLLHEMVERGSIHLMTFGGFPEELWGLDPARIGNVRRKPISEYHYMLHQAQPDVVLNRVEPSEFNLAKSNIKWIEATLAGALTMASNHGEMRAIPEAGGILIDHGEGELEQWRDELETLVQLKRYNPEALTVMVDRSRQEIEQRWSAENAGQMWLTPLAMIGGEQS